MKLKEKGMDINFIIEVTGLSKEELEEIEEISNDERERWLADLREKYIMNQKAIEEAGIDKGIKIRRNRGTKKDC